MPSIHSSVITRRAVRRPVDRGDEEAAFGDEILAQLGGRGGLLRAGRARALVHCRNVATTSRGPQPRRPRRPSLRPARRPIRRCRSRRRNPPRCSGRSTLTATCWPSVVTARWTWAIEAAPTGSGSTSANTSSSGLPRPCSIAALIASNGAGRQAVLEQREIVRGLLADQIGPGRQRLAELDRGRADLLEGLGIGRARSGTRAPKRAIRRGGGPAAACWGRARCRAARRAAPAPGPISAAAR